MVLSFTVLKAFDGKRLTDVLTGQERMSTRQKKNVRVYGKATRNGLPIRLIDPVFFGDKLVISDGNDPSAVGNDHHFSVLFEDDSYIAINKPSGLLTHPSVHSAESVLDSLGLSLRAVGRLDKVTSGVLLLAKDAHSHHVSVDVKARKLYLGFCHGHFQAKRVRLDAPIQRSNQQYIRRVVRPEGKRAVTRVLSLAHDSEKDVSLVAFRLDTGRTHQIRVHTLWNGNPLLGDWLYGLNQLEDVFPGKGLVRPERAMVAERLYTKEAFQADQLIARTALHAYALTFFHAKLKRYIRVSAPLSPDLMALYRALNLNAFQP